jgi:anti-anti-sigma factor
MVAGDAMPGGDGELSSRVGDPLYVQRVFDQMPLLVVAMEAPDFRLGAATARARMWTGRPDIVGQAVADAFPEMMGQQLFPIFHRVYETGQPETLRNFRVQIDLPDTGGHAEYFTDFSVNPLLGSDGQITGVIADVIDVTERVHQQRADRQRAATAERRFEQARDVIDTLQRALLPVGLPVIPGVDVAATYLLADADTSAGGDWFDALTLPDGRVALVVGDVVGHGVQASAVMGQLRVLLADRLLDTGDIGLALEAVDRLAERVPAARWATVCAAVLDPAEGTLTYCTAGHPAPLLVPTDGEPRYLAPTGAGPLGSSTEFPLGRDRLDPADLLVLYTDGILERPGRALPAASVELAQVAADVAAGRALATPEPTVAERVCTQTLELLTRVTGHTDDITLLAAQRVTPAANLALTLPAVAESLRQVRARVTQWLDAAGVTGQDGVALQHAVGELAANVVEHAYRGAAEPGELSVDAALGRDACVRVVVRDDGQWQAATPGDGRGRGLSMVTGLVDELTIEHPAGPTTVSLVRHVTRPAHLLTTDVFTAAPVGNGSSSPAVLQVDQPTPSRLRVSGPVDIRTAGELAERLLAATTGGTRSVSVDLTGVTHLASAGVSVLYLAESRSLANDAALRLVAQVGSTAQQILTLVGLEHDTSDD